MNWIRTQTRMAPGIPGVWQDHSQPHAAAARHQIGLPNADNTNSATQVRAREVAGSNLKILYAVTAPITAVGFLRGQLAHLAAQGFEVHLACSGDAEVRRLAGEEGVTFHEVPLSRSWMSWGDLVGLARAVRILRRVRPTVLNYSTPKAALVWALACVLGRRPSHVVYLLRGLRLDGERTGSLSFAMLWLCEAFAARVANTVVCVSEGVRTRAIALRVAPDNTAVVLGKGSSNGVDSERFSPSPAHRRVVRQELGYAEGDIVVGFVGRLTHDKGIYDLLEAVRELPLRVRALLVGPAEPDLDLELLWRRYADLIDRIKHVDYTRSVEDYYAAMDVFVLPSVREGMSNALLEAQAMQLPCVTTKATGCLDAIAPGVSSFVVSTHAPGALAQAIERLAADVELRESMGLAGRHRVVEYFDPETLWRRYAQLYKAAAHRARRPDHRTAKSSTGTAS